MKYLKKLNEYATSTPLPNEEELDKEVSPEEDDDNFDPETDREFDERDPVGTNEGPLVVDSDDLDTEGMKGVKWEAEMEGIGDYKVTFKNLEGKETSVVFKDTGNRRTGEETEMSAAFVSLPGTSGDGKNYVAEAHMKKNPEGNYEIESFAIYEH